MFSHLFLPGFSFLLPSSPSRSVGRLSSWAWSWWWWWFEKKVEKARQVKRGESERDGAEPRTKLYPWHFWHNLFPRWSGQQHRITYNSNPPTWSNILHLVGKHRMLYLPTSLSTLIAIHHFCQLFITTTTIISLSPTLPTWWLILWEIEILHARDDDDGGSRFHQLPPSLPSNQLTHLLLPFFSFFLLRSMTNHPLESCGILPAWYCMLPWQLVHGCMAGNKLAGATSVVLGKRGASPISSHVQFLGRHFVGKCVMPDYRKSQARNKTKRRRRRIA